MWIEPYVGYSEWSEDADSASADYNLNNSNSYQIGIGLYGINKLGAEFELYYGAALAAAKSERDYESKYTSEFINETYTTVNKNEVEATEYMIKPTLGVSYLINENFSIALDAGIYYRWGEEKSKNTYNRTSPTDPITEISETTADLKGIYTFTNLVFRMMF